MKKLEFEFHPHQATSALATMMLEFNSFTVWVDEADANYWSVRESSQKALVARLLGGESPGQWARHVLAHGRENCLWSGGDLIAASTNGVTMRSERGVTLRISRFQWNRETAIKVNLDFGRDSRVLAAAIRRIAAEHGGRRTA